MWQLQLWDDLTDLVCKKPKTVTCGATYASVICTLKNHQFNLMDDYLLNSRMRLADSLTAMSIEDSDTYTQAYKTITQYSYAFLLFLFLEPYWVAFFVGRNIYQNT